MNNPGAAGLVVAHVFAALLLLAVVTRTHWRWPVKAGAVATGIAFFTLSWLAFPALLGWPIHGAPPQKFRLHAAQIQQPDRSTRGEGAIYLWVTDARDLAHSGTPRAYAFPYSAPMHEAVLNAVARIGKGLPQMGELHDPAGLGTAVLHDPGKVARTTAAIAFFDIPDPLFPDK